MVFIIGFILLFTLPIIEIAVILQAGAAIGWLWVILLALGTAVLGAFIIRVQGLGALHNLQEAAKAGDPPVAPMVDGMFLLVAAPLLMTPGFVTDGLGFLLLVPPLRYALARLALRRLQKSMQDGSVTIIRR